MQLVGYAKKHDAFIGVQEKPFLLINIDQFNIVVNKDGVIYDAKDPKNNSPEFLVAILTQLAILNNGQNLKEGVSNAFSSIKNSPVLLKISGSLAGQFDKFLGKEDEIQENKPEKADAFLFRQGRGSIFSLMEALAVQAGKLEDKETQKAITCALKKLVEKEPFRNLRDFACESITGRMTKHELPGTSNTLKEIKELIYPSYPPSFTKLNIKRYVDDSGTDITDHMKFLKLLRFNCKKTKDGDYIFSSKKIAGTGSKNKPVTIHVPNPEGESAQSIYEHVGDKSITLIDSWGHAGYGDKIDKALSNGKEQPGDGQIIAHFECWSANNIARIKNRYPGAQLITTTESTTDNLDEVCSKWLLTGLIEGWKWQKTHKYVIKELQEKFGRKVDFKEFNLKNHYIFPHMRLNAQYIDRDNDGIKDSEDHLFNVTYPVKCDLAFGYEPVKQDFPDYALNGENLNKAVDQLKQIISYNKFLEKNPIVPWESDKIECDGFFTPEKNGTTVFRFNIDKGSNKLHLSLSKDFSHSSSSALSRMLSYEAGCFLGKEAGLPDEESVILGLAMLDRAIHQGVSGNDANQISKWIAPVFEEIFLCEKYGLSGVSFNGINDWLGIKGEDDGTKDDFKRLIEKSRGVLKVNQGLKWPINQRVININKIPIPEKIVVTQPSDISQKTVEEILPKLGIKVKHFSCYPIQKGKNGPIAVTSKDESNKMFTLLLGFNSEGNLHSAGKLNFDVKEVRDKVIYNYLSSFAKDAKLDPYKLSSIYKENIDNGKPMNDALLAAFRWARPICPPGTKCEDSRMLRDTIKDFGLDLSTEFIIESQQMFERLFPIFSGQAKDEKDLFNWIEKVSGIAKIDKKKLEDTYLSKLVEGKSRSAAIYAMLELFPDSMPKAIPPFPGYKVFCRLPLFNDPEVKNLLELLRKKAGVTNGDILMDVMENKWLEDSSNRVKNACRKAAKSAIAEDKSAVEFIKAAAKAAYKEDPSVQLIRYNFYLLDLQKLGFISESEIKSLIKYLNREFNYNLES